MKASRKRAKRSRKPPPIDESKLEIKSAPERAYSWIPPVANLLRERFFLRPFFIYEHRRILPKRKLSIDGLVADISSGLLASCPWLENLLRTELQEIAIRWRKTRIRRILNDCVPSFRNGSYEKVLGQTVSYDQLHAFISRCFAKIISPGFIGISNRAVLTDDFSKIIYSANTREIMDLQRTIAKLTISEVAWIKKCRIQPLQVVLLGDSVRFLFHFILGCIRSVMNFVEINRVKGGIVIYRYDVWRRLEREGLKEFIKTQQCEPVLMSGGSRLVQANVLRFQMTSKNLRPIVRLPNQALVIRQKQVNAILRFLVDSDQSSLCKSGSLAKFPRLFAHYRENMELCPEAKFYIFTGDVSNCFPCISHAELKRIIETSTRGHSQYFVALDAAFYGQYAAGLTKHEAIGRLRRGSTGDVTFKTFSRQELLDAVDLNRVIKYRDRFLRANRGVAQGSHTSGSLCELFLAHIEREKVQHLVTRNITFMFRYADDYLIISHDLEEISSIVYMLLYSLIEYGFQMKTDKMSMNFDLPNVSVEKQSVVKWCGFTISEDLNIDIDVERIENRTLHVPVQPRDDTMTRKIKLADRLKILLSRKYAALRVCARTRRERRLCGERISSLAMKNALPKLLKCIRLHRIHRGTREYFKKLKLWVKKGFKDPFM